MSNALATIQYAIGVGLSENAHITKATVEHLEMQRNDIVDSLFSPAVRWAVKAYLQELEAEERSELPEDQRRYLVELDEKNRAELMSVTDAAASAYLAEVSQEETDAEPA